MVRVCVIFQPNILHSLSFSKCSHKNHSSTLQLSVFFHTLVYILERMWFNLDILYDVLTEMGMPTVSGDYKGPTVMEIVEGRDSISTIYT